MLRQLNASASSSSKQAITAQAFQAARPRQEQDDNRRTATGVDAELDRYMQEVTDVATDNGLLFWQEREHSYPAVPAPGTTGGRFRLSACLSGIR